MKVQHAWKSVLLGAAMLAAGCAQVDNRTPEELLSLASAGLSGVDEYVFQGQSAVTSGSGTPMRSVSFQGSVTGHYRLKMESSGSSRHEFAGAGEGQWDPVKLLQKLRQAKKTVTVDAARSDRETTVLQIELDPQQSTGDWRRRLKEEWAAVAARKPQNEKVYASLSEPLKWKFVRDWNGELRRSASELGSMLDSLQVVSTYEVAVDRNRLLPLQITELSQLDYRTSGIPRQEARKTDIRFVSFDGGDAPADARGR